MADFGLTRRNYSPVTLSLSGSPETVRYTAQEAPQGNLGSEYARALRRRYWLVIVFAVMGCAGGILYTLPQPLTYEAKTSLDIQGLNENFLNMRAVDPNGMPGSYPAEAYLSTQIKLLQSHSMLDRAAEKVLKQKPKDPIEANDKWSELRERLGWGTRPVLSYEKLVADVTKSVKVKPMGVTRLVEASCESTHPQLAVDFCNTLATEFIDKDIEVRWDTAQKTSEYLTRQLQDVREKLRRSEEQLQANAQESTLLYSQNRESVAQERLRQLQTELSKAQADRMVKQAQYELISSSAPESLPPVLDSGPLREYQMKLSTLKGERARQGAVFTPEFGDVKKLDAEIRELENILLKERSNIVARIRNEHAAAQQRETLLSAAYLAQERAVSALAPKAAAYNMLLREVESSRQLYETLLQRVKEAGFVTALRSSPVRVVDLAQKPEIPSAPRRTRTAAGGLVAGTLAGMLAALLRERTDRKLRKPGDSMTYLRVRELGVIPAASSHVLADREIPLLSRLTDGFKQNTALPVAVNGVNVPRRPELATYRQRGSLMAESYRAVMTSLLLAEKEGERPGVTVVVTSPSVGEGKTTLASNLGIALSQINRRVVLVDGDLRKPRLHEIFDLDNSVGFGDVLKGEVDVKTCPLDLLARPTIVPGLFVVPAGGSVDDAASALFSTHTKEFLDRLRKEFGTVLIDTPPMLHLSDARVLARQADGVVLVFRAGVTSRESAMNAQEIYAADGTAILGTVLNDFNPTWDPSHDYYKSYYRYQRQS